MNYKWLDEYLLSMKGSKKDYQEEWCWHRYLLENKMFAAICKDSSGERDILTLKLDPMEGDFLRNQFEEIIPGHYMNKEHWNSIYLDGNVPEDVIKDSVKKSYNLILLGFSKKKQKEILCEL